MKYEIDSNQSTTFTVEAHEIAFLGSYERLAGTRGPEYLSDGTRVFGLEITPDYLTRQALIEETYERMQIVGTKRERSDYEDIAQAILEDSTVVAFIRRMDDVTSAAAVTS